MTEKIQLEELLNKIRDPAVPSSDLSKYYKIIPNKDKPLTPEVIINPQLVQHAPTPTAAVFGDLVISAAMERRQNMYHQKIKDGWDGLRLVSEGDSWFQYPSFLWINGADLIDMLFDKYAIFCKAFAGDTLENMVNNENLEEISNQIQETKADGLLISGGGNDLAGRNLKNQYGRGLGRYIMGNSDNDKNLTASDYIREQEFKKFLDNIESNYKKLFKKILHDSPKVKIFCHGYDHAYVFHEGTWLYPALSDPEKAIPEKHWNPIIELMIDKFNERLESLSIEYYDSVVYVNCRGSIGQKDQWRDELHGKKDGCWRAADRFQSKIDSSFSTTTL